MSSDTKTETYLESIISTLKENQLFFDSNQIGKEVYDEVIELINDVIDLLPFVNDLSTAVTPFVMNGLMPYSYGISLTLYSGNIVASIMQLRFLIEYLALTVLADNIDSNHALEKLSIIRNKYENKSLSRLLSDFDSDAYELWKLLSKWLHAKTYSIEIERIIINQGVKTWSIIQPAPYHKEDEEHLSEFLMYIKKFREILKRKLLDLKISGR